MSGTNNTGGDPLEFIKGMWGSMGFNLPGMVTPTLDVDELDKRIKDLKTVEGWLKLNLNMLTMSIQGLEVQRAALGAMKAMSEGASSSDPQANPFASAAMNPAMWPWNFMPQGEGAAPVSPAAAPAEKPAAAKPAPKK
ncbi:MAG: hypothetical protein PHU46_05005 [Rhodocyclaceae bacterium]|nr:hypothetical protein [Rhodocyclaceae bacterium]